MEQVKDKNYWVCLLDKYGQVSNIAEVLGVHSSTVRKQMNKFGIRYSNTTKFKDVSNEVILSKYNELGNIEKTARFFGVYGKSLRKRISSAYVGKSGSPAFRCNEEFFMQDTERSFYWAGFLMADGWLTDEVRGKRVSMQLQYSDINVLDQLKEDLHFDGNIIKKKSHESMLAQISIRSDKLFDSLNRFGVIPRKTFLGQIPDFILAHQNINHFVRGLFDGDGCIYLGSSKSAKRAQAKFSLTGNNKILEQVQKILELNQLVSKRANYSSGIRGWAHLDYGGNGQVSRIREFLYKNATIFLSRKKNKFYDRSISPIYSVKKI